MPNFKSIDCSEQNSINNNKKIRFLSHFPILLISNSIKRLHETVQQKRWYKYKFSKIFNIDYYKELRQLF